MDFYLPSDIARVVLSYLKENSYTKTYNCFMEECSLLQEYCMLVKTGRTPRITHLPQLGSILDEWGKLKQSERVFEKQDLSIQCSLAQEHYFLINDVTKLTSVSPLKSISNQPERQTFSKCRAPSGERSDKTTPHNGNIRATPQSKKVLFSPIPKSASDLKTWNDDCDSTAESLTTNSCLKSHHVVCPSSTLELNGNVDTDNDHCASSRTAENFAIVTTPAIVSALDRSEVSLANHEEGSHDEGSLDKKSSSHNAPCTLLDNTSTSIVAPDVTPKKAELPLDKAWVTPVKLLLQHEANKSPRRKKPKTPRKRVSDGHTRSAEAAADRQVDTQPFFQQILSDTRLHEKIAETCNSLVSGGLKHSSRHGDKSAIKESANHRKLSAEEQETLFACKSLEEVLETGSDLDMLEKFDMSDPVYETLFKMFGTDRTTFLEGLRKEKSESEIQAENEELERSIHEIYEECASMAANSPHLVASQQELLGATAPFTPLLRVHKLVSKAPHTSASEGSSPVYPPESPFRHSNPATPIQHDPCQSYSDSVQLSSPNSHHHLHSTPHGPSAVKKHANHKICSENILSNCSPLVKGDLCPGSPIMMQTNAPRTRKNIMFSSDNSGSYFSSIAASQAQTSVEQSQPCFAALTATGPSQSGVAQQEMHTGFLQFLGETVEQMDLGSSTLPGTLVAQPPCSTIENSIDCISLPKPNTTSVGARAHGQGMGKKGGRRKQSTKKSKKGQVKSETQSFSTLKGLLEKPQLSRNVFPLSLTPKKNEPSAFTNQNITIVSPGGSRIDIPLLECADAVTNKAATTQSLQTISIWNQSCTSTAQCIVTQNVNLPSTHDVYTSGPAEISVSESTDSIVSNTVELSSVQERKKSYRGRKDHSMSSSPRSGKSVELDMSDKLIATPILHNSVVDRAHVRSLHFGALADDPNIAQFRKIKPKLAEDSIAPRVIIVHASQFVPTTTPVLTHAVPQRIPVPTKPDETILTGSNKSSESQKSNSESKSPLKTPNKNSHRTGVFKGEVSRSNGDTLMNISSVIQSKSPQTMCEIKDCQKEQNSSVESRAIGIYESKGVNKIAAKEKQHKRTSFENNSKELRNMKIEDKKNQIIVHDQVQMEDQNKSEHDSQKQCISQGLNQPNEVTRKESNDEKQKETNKSGIRKNRKSVNKLKVKIPSVSRTNVNLKSPEIKKSLVVFTKKKHAPVGDVESNCATADDLPLAVLRKQIKQSTNGVKKSGNMVEGSHATKECDSSRNKMGSFLSKQQTSYKTHTDKDFGSNQNTKIKRETCSTNGDHDRNRKSNDNNYTIRNINSNNKLTAAIVKVEDITDKVCCLSKHRQYSEPSTPKKQVSESEEVTPSKEQMLEKVGLTPTKSVSATISPKRASVLEFLSDWRRSPSAKTKTPNTRSKQRKLEEIMKYPLTPRRRSLFKSPTSSTNEIITENIDDKQKSEKTVKRVNNILGKLHKNNPADNLISCVKDRTEIVKETLLADSDQALDGPCQRLFAIDTNTAKINKNLKYNRVTISDDIKSPEKECEDESLVKTISESVCSENNLGDIDELETSVNNLVDIMEKDVPTKAAASSIIDTDLRENSYTDMNYKFTIVKETSSQVPLVEGGKHISSELHTVEISLKNTSIYQKTLIMENAAANLNKENIGGNQDNCDHKSCDLCEPTTSELLEEISVNSNNSLNTKILREVPERHHKKKNKHKHRHKHFHDKSNDENSEFTNHRKHVLSVSEEGEPKHKPRPRQSRSDPHGTELDMASSEGARQSALVDEQGHTHGQNSHKEDTGLTSADAARDRLRNDHQHGDAGPGSHRAKRKRSHSPPGSHTTKRLREEKSLAELNIDEALSKLYAT